MKKIIMVISVILLAGALLTNISCAQKGAGGTTGEKAPDFTLEDINGKKVNLNSVVSDSNATLLVFWATWCPHCTDEIPELKQLTDEYKAKGLRILAVDIGESAKKVSSFAEQQGINYTVLLDGDNSVANQYQVMGIPTNILVGKGGTIKYRGTRPPSKDLLP